MPTTNSPIVKPTGMLQYLSLVAEDRHVIKTRDSDCHTVHECEGDASAVEAGVGFRLTTSHTDSFRGSPRGV